MKTPIQDIFALYEKGICHRGLHDLERPENSKAAFEEAIRRGFPFECDVNITKDKRFVVNHDNDLLRVTGKAGKISELTLAEIKEGYRLGDGSELLSIEELLSLWSNQVPLVLEIKCSEGQESDIIENIRPYLSSIEDKSKIVLISFSSAVLKGLDDLDINVGKLFGLKQARNEPEEESLGYDFLDVQVDCNILFARFWRSRRKKKLIMTWTINGRRQAFEANRFANAMTFELVNSAKPLKGQKVNKYLLNHVKKYSK